MFNKGDRGDQISRLENRYGLTTENATTLYERRQRVQQIRHEAEKILGHALPHGFSNGFIEAFYNLAPEIAVSMWKVQLDKQATPDNCTILLDLEARASDLRDHTKWFSIVVQQDNFLKQQLEVKLSPSGGLAEFARWFEGNVGEEVQLEELRQGEQSDLKLFQDAIFESVMEHPSESFLQVVGLGEGRWTFSPQLNLKMSLLVGLNEEGGGRWLPKIQADYEALLAQDSVLTEDDPEDQLAPPTIADLVNRRREYEEWTASAVQGVTASKIVAALESGLSMSDLCNPEKLYNQFCKEHQEEESASKKSVALAYLRQHNPPTEGVAEWVDDQIEEERTRVERRTDHLAKASTGGLHSETKIEIRNRLIYSQYVLNALTEHAEVLKQELTVGFEEA